MSNQDLLWFDIAAKRWMIGTHPATLARLDEAELRLGSPERVAREVAEAARVGISTTVHRRARLSAWTPGEAP